MTPPDSETDRRYARGEITRQEWRRLHGPGGSPPPSVPRRPPTGPSAPSTRTWVAILVVLVVAVVAVAVVLASFRPTGLPVANPSVLPMQELGSSDLAALNASATRGMAFAGNNTLWFGPGAASLVVYASPGSADMAFEIQHMANPTLDFAPGTRVTVVAVNMDPREYHTWSLSTQSPPYSSMPMMGSGGMMTYGTMMGTGMMGPASASAFWSQQVSFTTNPGSYWYLCAVAGHASSGMYGGFVVG